ncbi:class D sortase [Virgibacillus oceani]
MGIRKWIGTSLLLIGLILVLIPLYYEWEQNKEVAALEQALKLIEDEQMADLASDEDLPLSKQELKDVFHLEIPSINLKQPVLGETTEENLELGLTQIKGGQEPGEGNFTIAGHRGYRGDRHFRKLPDVPEGAEVILHAEGEQYIYEVTSIEIIEATNVEILEDHTSLTEITLITCTRDGQQRIAVKGKLKDKNL